MEQQKVYFNTGITKDYEYRMEKLCVLRRAIKRFEKEIIDALKKDLNKPKFEAYETEIGIVLEELNFMIRNLARYMKHKVVRTPITQFYSTSRIYSEPYGVVLIVSPWNYPFQLTIAPLIGAIAAGNCAVLKPSNYSPHTSAIIEKIIKCCYHEAYVTVVQGGRKENEMLFAQPFDYIFFTGSVTVGKIVMEAAAKNLTPISLELGGKSPCIVDKTANIELAARRIVWGKFLNAGQTCVAPDYLYVDRKVKDELIQKMKKYILRFYGKDASTNEDFPRIISEKHYRRLLGLTKDCHIAYGGQSNDETLQIAPTVLDQVTWESAVMEEEIFGPILPILEFDHLKDVIADINRHPKPLALYYFTTSKKNEQQIIKNISYGGGCINDTIMHLASSHLPFGGVGNSGMGSYHGKESFHTFSHKKSVLKKTNLIDMPFRYPPYTKQKFDLIKKVLK